jgi:hypothetical protein
MTDVMGKIIDAGFRLARLCPPPGDEGARIAYFRLSGPSIPEDDALIGDLEFELKQPDSLKIRFKPIGRARRLPPGGWQPYQ